MADDQGDLTTRVIADVCRWLGEDEPVWLCTVIQTWGSSPRPVGSLLAVNARGDWSGSVSGGCLEEELICQARDSTAAEDHRPEVVDYGIAEEDQARYALPCGGRMRLLIEPLQREWDLGHFSGLLAELEEREPVSRLVDIETGERRLLDSLVPGMLEEGDGWLRHTLGPQCRMLLIGAGEVARYVGRIARMNDFAVTLCEPREAFLKGWDEPGISVRQCLPDDLIESSFHDRYCAILALGHDPRIDDMGLIAALRSDAFYIGAMGSSKTAANRRTRLYELGVSEDRLGRLHAPIGFHIGSKAPGEIAVSILAQVLAERYRLLRRAPRR